MLTVHHIDGHGRERFIAVSDVRYVPKGPGARPAVHFDRCDGSNEATGFSYGHVRVLTEGGVTIHHIVLGEPDEDKSLVG